MPAKTKKPKPHKLRIVQWRLGPRGGREITLATMTWVGERAAGVDYARQFAEALVGQNNRKRSKRP